ncbi:hypothetical protein WM08_20780 [Burkholderia ubonensis]|uniref:Uncharacterized protein n=2 Tax=Burkholderia ubonensis TaxID=101571 RepID=A0A106PQZ5_9BURK|nr:hypothetical protein [Burkholderia ubonensis]KVP35588.1 hypothetical protein WJ87_14545 [Burkholderia ubonensis]KVR59379.1 hypothetical protein WK19_06025 [Burkholderia ubonensis]KVU67928.1 hypothetical protein WK73_24945 [Burkholderia ubonensis]KWA72716.1 hypothetical protein WL29_04545 [Burkholderia ubonensis]KWD51248.1 hypothetical protein WL65_07370 [Burkholderia ubonensis]
MTRQRRWALCALAALCCTSSMAASILKLSRTELTVAPGKPVGTLRVENTGDTPLYLDVEQHLVANPGETPERLLPVSEVERPSLLVLPNRLALAPGQTYQMVVKELSTPSKPHVWRVTFRPKERILVETSQHEKLLTPLFIRVGYGAVIYQLNADYLPK